LVWTCGVAPGSRLFAPARKLAVARPGHERRLVDKAAAGDLQAIKEVLDRIDGKSGTGRCRASSAIGEHPMEEPELVVDYEPRPQFAAFHRRSERFACIVTHRRAGKTVACVQDPTPR